MSPLNVGTLAFLALYIIWLQKNNAKISGSSQHLDQIYLSDAQWYIWRAFESNQGASSFAIFHCLPICEVQSVKWQSIEWFFIVQFNVYVWSCTPHTQPAIAHANAFSSVNNNDIALNSVDPIWHIGGLKRGAKHDAGEKKTITTKSK